MSFLNRTFSFLNTSPFGGGVLLCFFALLLPVTRSSAQQAPAFTKIVVFGDSLSDDGNIRNRTRSKTGGVIDYPSGSFGYSDGRFTNSSDTDPRSLTYVGVWHEQLARTFLTLPVATNSLDGGLDYAFGSATTIDGTTDRVVVSTFGVFGDVTVTINNIGFQVDDYLGKNLVDPDALYIVWGGGNDLFDDDSAANVSATVSRVAGVDGLVTRLAKAGVRNLLVPNVPALGAIPQYSDDQAKQASLNRASSDYRQQLAVALAATVQSFANQGIQLHLYELDVWLNFVRTLTAPADYGFTDIRHSAQGNSSANPDQYLFWDDKHPTTAGHYQTAKEANRVLSGAVSPNARALNVSTRVSIGVESNVAIGGFIVTGDGSKKVMVRAIGPSLSNSGVANALPEPTVSVYDQAQALVGANDDWKQSSQQAEIIATTLAPKNDLESAVIITLQPGNYTAVVSGKNGATGIGLVEVYDLSTAAAATLGNVSTRGFVGTGDNVMIGGFIIGAGESPLVFVRAIGPSLASVGINAPLLDPTVELHDGNGLQIGANDNWRDSQPVAIKATTLAPTDDRESAIVMSLAPGNYTVLFRDKTDTTGIALVEAYRIP
ncbi:MAG: SGNH/GDSL hydrolase family protein [Chthoniobacterales bacterium]